jgi:hypothetical protein
MFSIDTVFNYIEVGLTVKKTGTQDTLVLRLAMHKSEEKGITRYSTAK